MKNPNETKTGPPGGGDKRRGLDEDKSGSDRKKGRGNETNHAVVKNLFPHSEICMLANKTWAGDFAGKCNDARPKWNEKCKCCPCWFLQKYCFSDCNLSHPPSFSECWHGSRHGATDGPG